LALEAEAQRCRDRSALPPPFVPGSGGRLSPTGEAPAAGGEAPVTQGSPATSTATTTPLLTSSLGRRPTAHVLHQPVDAGGGAAGGDGAGRPLAGDLDGGPEKVHLLPMGAVDVVLPRGQAGGEGGGPRRRGDSGGDGDAHVDAGVVEEEPVAGQGHVLLLPLLVEGVAAALQQEALGTEGG